MNRKYFSNSFFKTKWTIRLNLLDWDINFEEINIDQVLYDQDIPLNERYFIGVQVTSISRKEATIIYDRLPSEEDILHELLHIKYPILVQAEINELTTILMTLSE
jgi:hypothetical protein